MYKTFLSFLGIFYFTLFSIHAENLGLDIHGSISQSFIKTTKNDFLFKGTSDGSFEFSEAVLNVSKSVNNELRIGAQLLSRNFGDEGNFKSTLDWGYGDYQLNQKFGLRGGKIRLPLGFYNEYRDVDAAQTQILLQQGPYFEPMRAFILSYSGFGIYGNLFSESKLGNIDYDLYVGTLDIPSDFSLLRFINLGLNTTGGLDSDRIFGGRTIWNTPVEGLRFGYSLLDYKGVFDTTSPQLIFNQALTNFSISDGIEFDASMKIAGIEYQKGAWSFSAEYQMFQMDGKFSTAFQNTFLQSISNASLAAGQSSAVASATAQAALAQTSTSVLSSLSFDQASWYLTANYQYNEKLSQFISYGEMYADKSNKGPAIDYRKDTSTGICYEFSSHWRIKAEYHHYSGSQNALLPPNKTSIANKWDMFAARVAFDF